MKYYLENLWSSNKPHFTLNDFYIIKVVKKQIRSNIAIKPKLWTKQTKITPYQNEDILPLIYTLNFFLNYATIKKSLTD